MRRRLPDQERRMVTRNILICPLLNRCSQSINVTSPETYGPAIRMELLGQGSSDAPVCAANHHYPTRWINHFNLSIWLEVGAALQRKSTLWSGRRDLNPRPLRPERRRYQPAPLPVVTFWNL